MSDKDFYKNAMDKIALHTMEEIDTKQIRQKKKNMHARHRKMAAAVALVILITGGTVYAAKIGIFDAIFQNTKQLYNQQKLSINLKEDSQQLQEVVVVAVGYGDVRRKKKAMKDKIENELKKK